jgi:cation diffusion facilitator CzcD-associated flavoprotein CzcO
MNGDHALYEVSRQYLGEPRPIKIIVIGAGLSGIAAVKLFREQFAGKPTQLVVYEKNSDVGGTWFENRYPG